jgi:pyroglutamyl-peptidase
VVVAVGQAGGRPDVTVERVAINVDDARIPDNAGCSPVDEPVVDGGPAAYFSTLPVKACVAAMTEAGVPASVSQTAGTFVCNHVFYRVVHELVGRPGARGGFVHVPFTPEQAAGTRHPSMSLVVAAAGLDAVVRTSLAVEDDLRVAGGATH